ncbi:hypothetical protein CYANOKiyG1_66620 [Okeania sp. KiyG1]|nr:hypothetical protein CYANOKiyG1_66620 [Okeania sp. KiyG1]
MGDQRGLYQNQTIAHYNLEATSTETVLSFDNLNDITNGAGTRLNGVSVNLCQY